MVENTVLPFLSELILRIFGFYQYALSMGRRHGTALSRPVVARRPPAVYSAHGKRPVKWPCRNEKETCKTAL